MLLSAGCGVHYWQRSGAGVQGFQVDSQACIDEAKIVRYGIEPEHVYRLHARPRMAAGAGGSAGEQPVQGPGRRGGLRPATVAHHWPGERPQRGDRASVSTSDCGEAAGGGLPAAAMTLEISCLPMR